MPFTAEQTAEMREELETRLAKSDELAIRLVTRQWLCPRAREFAVHGLARRLRGLEHCAMRVFEAVPPDALVTDDVDRLDATTFLQSFMITCFGAIDNLAWVWILEADIRSRPGINLPDRHVGFGPDNQTVRGSLPDRVNDLLREYDEWFRYLRDYRHALAHRIPLYIPPTTMDDAGAAECARLEEKEVVPAAADRDWQRYHALIRRQRDLGRFEPVMMHSFGEQARPVYFHPQLVADLSTIVEIGSAVLDELPLA